ncbi:MAG: molybdopterin-dependent oxidoreductase [Acidimicrobiia bacterium]
MTLGPRSEARSLRLSGLVARESELAYEEISHLGGSIPDLGMVADGFVGRAVPMRAVIDRARPDHRATYVTVESDDGFYRASIPLSELAENGWLAYSLGEGPLPRERGGPLRVVVPLGRTLCWNVKSVAELRFTARPEPDSVPDDPPH